MLLAELNASLKAERTEAKRIYQADVQGNNGSAKKYPNKYCLGSKLPRIKGNYYRLIEMFGQYVYDRRDLDAATTRKENAMKAELHAMRKRIWVYRKFYGTDRTNEDYQQLLDKADDKFAYYDSGFEEKQAAISDTESNSSSSSDGLEDGLVLIETGNANFDKGQQDGKRAVKKINKEARKIRRNLEKNKKDIAEIIGPAEHDLNTMAALAPPSYGSRNAHIEQPVSNGPYTTPRFVWNAKCTDSLIDNLQRAVFALSASASMFVCDSYIIGGQDAQLVGRVFFPKLPYGQFCGPEDFREPQASTCSLYATKDCLFVLLGTKTDQRSIHDVVDGIFSKWGGLKDVVALDSVALEEVERANSSAAPSPATSSKLWSLKFALFLAAFRGEKWRR
eukprot:g8654.t1